MLVFGMWYFRYLGFYSGLDWFPVLSGEFPYSGVFRYGRDLGRRCAFGLWCSSLFSGFVEDVAFVL